MPKTPLCPACGKPLPSDAPAGFCPWCSFRGALGEEPVERRGMETVPPAQPEDPMRGLPGAGGRVRYFGDYELLAELGRGGMGVVYRARQLSLNRQVAVKILLHRRFSEDALVKRFQTEAEAVAQLDHPNIVPIYEVGEHEGQHYFSMKLIEGRGLDRELTGAPLSPRRAARWVATTARAVHYAHQHGVLHRDLKPHNIVLDVHDQPHLTDFGLAKLLKQDTGLTASAVVLGSPAYMAPEQAAGKTKQLTTAADVYSLGALLYALATGRPPFAGETALDTMRQVLERDPAPPRTLNPALDRDLETICLKCLTKEPARRYGSAEALADDLDRWLRSEPITARRVSNLERSWLWCRRKPVIASLALTSVVLFVLGFGGIVWQWRRVEAQRQQTQVALHRSEAQQYAAHVALAQHWIEQQQFDRARTLLEQDSLRRYRGWEWGWLERQCHLDVATLDHPERLTTVAFSPDGRFLLTGSRDHRLRLWNWDEGRIERVFDGHEGIAGACPGCFSPDGRRVLTFSWDTTARIWEVASGRPLQVLPHPQGVDGAQFSPDGTRVVTGAMDGVVRIWDADTGELLREAAYGDSVLYVAFSPDGQRIAYAGGPRFVDKATRDTSVVIWDLATDRQQVLHGHAKTVMCVAFSPDGETLASASFDGEVRLWEVATGRPLPGLDTGSGYRVATAVAFSPDGQTLAVAGTRQGMTPRAEIYRLGSLERVRVLEGHSESIRFLAFSRDGRYIATAANENQARVWTTAALPDYLSLEGHNAVVWTVACSDDGRRVATGSFDKTAKVWEVASGSLVQTITVGMPVVSLALSSDGQRVVTPTPESTATVWDVADAQPRFVLRGHTKTVMAVALSADHRWIATGSKDNTVRLWNATNGAPVRTLVGHGHWVLATAFSPDGRRLLTGGADHTAIVWDTGSGRRLQTLGDHDDWVLQVAFSPDAHHVATGSGRRDRHVRLWELPTGAVRWRVRHADGVTGLAFSPDGTRLASAAGTSAMYSTPTRDFHAAITDVRTGHGLLLLTAHSNSVVSVAFSPDGRRLVTGSGDNTARIRTALPWQPETIDREPTPSQGAPFEPNQPPQRRAQRPAPQQAVVADPPRTNRLDFLGEVNLPTKREVKTKPLLPIPLRDAQAGRQQIDLSACYNAALNETWQPVAGFDQADLNLAGLPRGLRDFGGVTFDVRGLVQLGRAAADWQWEWQTYPDQVRIPVGRSFNRFHALHGAAYSDPQGTRIGAYRLRYENGSEHALDIVYGHDLADWVGPADATFGQANDPVVLVWTGENPALPSGEAIRGLRLFRRTYQNPHPEWEVVGIDFVSALSASTPFLVALTVE